MKRPQELISEEFIQKVHTMGDEELLATYHEYHTKYRTLETERLQCWNRMMEIQKRQEDMSEEMACLNVVVHLSHKLTSK